METKLIQQKLKERNVRMVDIARSLKVSSVAVWLVIKGSSKSARISQAIADAIGRPVSEIWPETTKEKA